MNSLIKIESGDGLACEDVMTKINFVLFYSSSLSNHIGSVCLKPVRCWCRSKHCNFWSDSDDQWNESLGNWICIGLLLKDLLSYLWYDLLVFSAFKIVILLLLYFVIIIKLQIGQDVVLASHHLDTHLLYFLRSVCFTMGFKAGPIAQKGGEGGRQTPPPARAYLKIVSVFFYFKKYH